MVDFVFLNIKNLLNLKCNTQNEKRTFKYICNEIRRKFSYNRPQMVSYIRFLISKFLESIHDPESIANIEFLEKSFYCAVVLRQQYDQYNEYQLQHFQQFNNELPMIKKKYKNHFYSQEVFYFHNGLRFASNKIKNYIKDRDILDIGSYNGDSCTVLKDYTNKKIYSYDISQKNIKSYMFHMNQNKIPSSKYEIMRIGMSDKPGNMSIKACNNGGCSISSKGDEAVNLTTIDIEVEKKRINVGFIKADVEGVGFEVIKGGKETIKKQKPVIEFAVYHSFSELFGIFDFLKNQIGGYSFQIHSENMKVASAGEIALFAYPSFLD